MNFKSSLSSAYKILLEQEPPPDAAVPQPDQPQQTQSAIPDAPAPAAVQPQGYVEMVRLLAKALTINLPVGEIDDVFTTTPVTAENALAVKDALVEDMNKNASFEDNPERLQNPHYRAFYESINEKNFLQKYNEILAIMKKYVNT